MDGFRYQCIHCKNWFGEIDGDVISPRPCEHCALCDRLYKNFLNVNSYIPIEEETISDGEYVYVIYEYEIVLYVGRTKNKFIRSSISAKQCMNRNRTVTGIRFLDYESVVEAKTVEQNLVQELKPVFNVHYNNLWQEFLETKDANTY